MNKKQKKDAAKSLQKFTETEDKINKVLSFEQIAHSDCETLSDIEKQRLVEVITGRFYELKGEERDKFYKKIEAILTHTTKNQLWEYNHTQITLAISNFIQKYGRMPTNTEIAIETGLSRQTIHKHLKEYANHPQYLGQIEQFRIMKSTILAKVFQSAINGDTGAAKLYFSLMGCLNNGQPSINTSIQNQNNYIQINGTVLSQETIKSLSPEQLNTVETILKTILPQPEIFNLKTGEGDLESR